jgi:RpiR family carbohydrate utilization transcriptional regulator
MTSMAITIDIVTRIAERSGTLPPSEQKVALRVLADVPAASAASIDTLADQAGVSKASVTRFAKALGCTDVRDLKRQLVLAGAIGARFLHQTASDGDSAEIVHRDIIDVLQANRTLVNLASMRSAARILRSARMIYAFGLGGGSAAIADEARVRLVRLGLPIASYQDAVMQRVAAATMDNTAVVLAISATGQAGELLDSVAIARGYGAQVIAITSLGSRLASTADVLLPIQTRETDLVVKPSSSRYALLMMLDILAMEVAVIDRARSQDLLRRIKVVLDAHRGGPDRQPLGD